MIKYTPKIKELPIEKSTHKPSICIYTRGQQDNGSSPMLWEQNTAIHKLTAGDLDSRLSPAFREVLHWLLGLLHFKGRFFLS